MPYVKKHADKRDMSKQHHGKHYPNFSIHGTTYSGHPTRTTLGNTLRSIAYYKYVMEEYGVEPLMMAAGDDVVMWIPKNKAAGFKDHLYKYVYPDNAKEFVIRGLGQVVKEVFINEWWNIDFCSKYAVHEGNRDTNVGWYLFRDPIKAFKTKHFLLDTNPLFKDRPSYYVAAIGYSLKTELPIQYIRDLVDIRIAKHKNNLLPEHTLRTIADLEHYWPHKPKIKPQHHNSVQHAILSKVGVGYGSLITAEDGYIRIGRVNIPYSKRRMEQPIKKENKKLFKKEKKLKQQLKAAKRSAK